MKLSFPGRSGVWIAATALFPLAAASADLPLVADVEWQPLAASLRRLVEALDHLGAPFEAAEQQALEAALRETDSAAASERAQEVVDRHCLFFVKINAESRVTAAQGPARPELVEQGWRLFLVKVQNEAGVTAPLQAVSPNAQSAFEEGAFRNASDKYFRRPGRKRLTDPRDLWFDVQVFNGQPLKEGLSGLRLEYRILQLYSREAGKREAKVLFDVGQGTQDLGFRNEADVLFSCAPAREIRLRVHDENDQPTTGAFVFRDRQGQVYPSQSKRLAPDFAFHPQVYRADGETLRLPEGAYTVEFARGPESIPETRQVSVGPGGGSFAFKVTRWIDPSRLGWWSGDHHIHAAGCAHYTKPTEGVQPSDMMRHCLGEDLKVGCNLTWGPCFDYQKRFFTGQDDPVSSYPYLLHYDVEVSGFGSHQSGHLVLLRLREQIYPGGDSDRHWPTLGLNTLRWAKKQGAVCGPAHSGWGLEVGTADLPNYILPPYNGIGANEYVVDVTHEVPGPDGHLAPAVDFLSTVDTPYVWELNMWYHSLNVGFRTRISGETDFPCIYGERVGLGRSYVKQSGSLDYDDWCQGLREGRNYVSEGHSHILDFQAGPSPSSVEGGAAANAEPVRMGEHGSELRLSQPATVRLTARVAAWLAEQPNPAMKRRPYDEKPYWDLERARVEGTRQVPVEVVVNGYPAGRQPIAADGVLRDLSFEVKLERSSWLALRILPSSHTNPIFVEVGAKPIRASRRSAQWCLEGVDRCWSQKERFLKADEMDGARRDYDHAREVYQRRLRECDGPEPN
ncbi:MAG TPA: CehA/McbA family metallohydrolase [Dongiaceae bacterium]|nr:CehA/McbA family metallohydrolase [Dongiaceae bacterium]